MCSRFPIRRSLPGQTLNRDVPRAAPCMGLKFSLHKKARNRPDLLMVHRLEDARVCQPRVRDARLDRDPADGPLVRVSQQAGDGSRIHAGFLHLPRGFARVLTECLAAQFPEHAPASARRAARTEEPLEIGEAPGSERVKGEGNLFRHWQKRIGLLGPFITRFSRQL